MYERGQQHHHGVRKNIVEGIGGVVIGAAAVLLLVRLFKGKKAESKAVALPAPAKTEPAKMAPAKPPATRRAQPAKASATPAAAKTAAKTAAKRPSRAKPAAKPAGKPETSES